MHMRSMLIASVVGLSLACVAGWASGQQIYKWKDASGVTHFSQTPPTNGTHYAKMQLSAEPDVASNPPAASSNEGDNNPAPASAPAQTAAASSAPADTPANRADMCKQLNSNITLLQSKQPVVTGAAGKQTVMSDNTREQQLATARAQQTQYCSKGA